MRARNLTGDPGPEPSCVRCRRCVGECPQHSAKTGLKAASDSPPTAKPIGGDTFVGAEKEVGGKPHPSGRQPVGQGLPGDAAEPLSKRDVRHGGETANRVMVQGGRLRMHRAEGARQSGRTALPAIGDVARGEPRVGEKVSRSRRSG